MCRKAANTAVPAAHLWLQRLLPLFVLAAVRHWLPVLYFVPSAVQSRRLLLPPLLLPLYRSAPAAVLS